MMRVVRVGGFLAMLILGGCRGEPPPTVSLQADVATRAEVTSGGADCGLLSVDASDLAGRFDVIGEAIGAIREGSCPPLGGAHRLCRSLFLIGATDPLVGVGVGLKSTQIEQLVGWHHWALADGIDAARVRGDTAVAEALRAIDQLDLGAALLGEDVSIVAGLAVARADPDIIEPLAAAEQACLSLPR